MNFVHVASWMVRIALVVTGFGLSACGDDDPPRTVEDACRDSCVIQRSLNCAAETGQFAAGCESACNTAVTLFPQCRSQIQAVLDCPGLKVSSGWECDADGKSGPKATVCSSEQLALDTCTHS